jgi:hypothetical protein
MLWTIFSDYAATGEGRTLQALITYAADEKDAIKKFANTFDAHFAFGAEAKEGIVENDIIKLLFTKEAIENVRKMEGKANIKLFSEFHFNFS